MKVYQEISLVQFEFWGDAEESFEKLTPAEIGKVELILEEMYPDGIGENELNDLFRHELDVVAEWLNTTEEEILSRD